MCVCVCVCVCVEEGERKVLTDGDKLATQYQIHTTCPPLIISAIFKNQVVANKNDDDNSRTSSLTDTIVND